MPIDTTWIRGEKISLKKNSIFGWKVVYPIKNEDGSINWFNLFTGGNWANFFIVLGIVFLICFSLYEYASNINHLLSCFDNFQALEVCKAKYMVTQIKLP